MRKPPGTDFRVLVRACSPDPYHCRHVQGQLLLRAVLAELTRVFGEQAGEQGLGKGWRVVGDIGFVTHPHFVSGSADVALWGFSRGSMRVCRSHRLPGAAGIGAGDLGLTTGTASCILWGLSVQELHLFTFCICVGSKFPPLSN